MIPRSTLTAWRPHAPWRDDGQVEQDLVLTRALVELYSSAEVTEHVAFRGGTAFHKLVLPEPLRYSEDIDLVQRAVGPIRPVLAAIQAQLDPWLGKPSIEPRTGGWRLTYRFLSEVGATRKVKVEINTREHQHYAPLRAVPISVNTDWFSGAAAVLTYATEELLATKLRALYQRRKGRDLFDMDVVLRGVLIDDAAVVRLFEQYQAAQGQTVTRSAFEANLDAKIVHPLFLGDVGPLLRAGVEYVPLAAASRLSARILSRLA